MRIASIFAACFALAACSDSSDPRIVADAGPADAASQDAAAPADAAADALASNDASAPIDADDDAEPESDASAPDASVDADFTVAINDPYAYGSCFGGPPDPLLAFWNVTLTGIEGTLVAVSDAKLRVVNAGESYDAEQSLTVDMTSIRIPEGGTVTLELRKVEGTPAVPICTFCGDEVTGSIRATFTSGSFTHSVTKDIDSIGCVF